MPGNVDDEAPTDDHRSPRVLLALDKFKGTLTSRDAADAVRRGIERGSSEVSTQVIAVADGGDGTVEAAADAGYERQSITVSGPFGDTAHALIATHGRTAVAEVAGICGLAHQHRTDAEHSLAATSLGVGEALIALLERGFTHVILGLGGSATTDGGAGMLTGLGARLLDGDGHDLRPGGGSLGGLTTIDWSGLDPRLRDVDLLIASDVDSPLLGPTGAARMFAPQKGADAAAVESLEYGLGVFADVLAAHPPPLADATACSLVRVPGAGAAGGLGFGTLLIGGRIASGSQLMMELLDVRAAVAAADLVVTGEGSLDEQSLRGKVPVAIAAIAAEHAVPALAVVGRCSLSEDAWRAAGFGDVWQLIDVADTEASSEASCTALEQLGERLATTLAGTRPLDPAGTVAALSNLKRSGLRPDDDREVRCRS
ncbi:MAG: glycerate kinase [Nocardioidaceae bacterium]